MKKTFNFSAGTEEDMLASENVEDDMVRGGRKSSAPSGQVSFKSE